MNLPRPRVREEDSGETPVWRQRGLTLAIKVAMFLGGSLCTLGVIRFVPGGVVVGSIADVRQLAGRIDSTDHALADQHAALLHLDSTHTARLDHEDAKLALLIDNARANTRRNCAELGWVKAQGYGYRCQDGEAPLPRP